MLTAPGWRGWKSGAFGDMPEPGGSAATSETA